MIGSLFGIPVIESPLVPSDTAYVYSNTLVVGAPDLAFHGRWVRWYVRRGLSDVCEWLGEDVGPEPRAGVVRLGAP
jgi:hypothetical protein